MSTASARPRSSARTSGSRSARRRRSPSRRPSSARPPRSRRASARRRTGCTSAGPPRTRPAPAPARPCERRRRPCSRRRAGPFRCARRRRGPCARVASMALWGGVVATDAIAATPRWHLKEQQTPQTNQHRFAASHATRTSAWTSCSAPAKAVYRGRTSLRAYRKPSGKGAAGSGGRPTTGTGRAPPRLASRRTAATISRAARRADREQRATATASAKSQNGAASATHRSGAASGGGTAPSARAPSRRQRRRKACQSGVAITDDALAVARVDGV